ncbi:hypothetical protein WA026_016279 [Henosepilachna vigintioctopunctata]|uniref:Uncharacterized protein n=1 Tax=Henosepilachna vigintioctopunctata TaxID=420089 RepID=A0AAW1UEJ0_9CUCU
MSLIPWRKQNKKTKKDFRIMDAQKPENIPLDELEAISTIINMNPRSTRIRPDRVETLFHMQELSIIADPNQDYMIDFSSVKDERDFITISRVCFVVLGLFPKNTGQITISLRCDAYVNPTDKNEFSGTGGLNEMWGFVGTMSHSISTEDRDMLIVNVSLSGCTVSNANMARLIMLYEFCHGDIPMLYLFSLACFSKGRSYVSKPLVKKKSN